LAVTIGFASTFAVIGLIVNLLTDDAYTVVPWISVVIGVALVAFGIALLAGFELNLRLPHLGRGGRTTGIGSMVVFGVSYAIASIGCTLPVFVIYTSANFGRGPASGVAFFLAYAAGFGLLLTSLTLALALARQSLVRSVRRVLPYVNRVAGALLVLAGAYVAYYGTVEIKQGANPGSPPDSSIINRVTEWSSQASNWLQDRGATNIALVLSVGVCGALVFTVVARRTD
jgi:cytochrome c-type biogenesis protein